jgi:hypothetical protein
MSLEDNKALIRRLYDAANARDYETLRNRSTPEFGDWLAGAVRSGTATSTRHGRSST